MNNNTENNNKLKNNSSAMASTMSTKIKTKYIDNVA